MKKIIMTVMILILAFTSFTDETKPETWINLYRISDMPEYKVEVLENIAASTDPAYSQFFESNITWLSRNIDLPPFSDGEALAIKQALIIIGEASKYDLINSAGALFTIYKRSPIYDIKIAAIKGIGDLNAVEYGEQLSQALQYCNSYQSVKKDVNLEILAAALIQALGQLKPQEAFEDLLYATDGWYSSQIKEAAYKVLISLADDPGELIQERAQYLSIRYSGRLLQLIMDSDATQENKEKTVLFLIDLLYKDRSNEYVEEISSYKTNAVLSLSSLNSKNPENVKLLIKVYKKSNDNTERRAILEYMGINGSDEAVNFLGERVLELKLHSTSRRGLNHDELSELKQMISSLGNSGHEEAETYLMYVVISDFTPAIKQMASDAIKGN